MRLVSFGGSSRIRLKDIRAYAIARFSTQVLVPLKLINP